MGLFDFLSKKSNTSEKNKIYRIQINTTNNSADSFSEYKTLEEIDSLINYYIKKKWSISAVWDKHDNYEYDLTYKYQDLTNYSDEEADLVYCDHMWTYDEEETNDNYEDIMNEYGIDYIYHMTHYQNLESILENGLLSHNNDLVNEHIDNAEVNDRRNKSEPINNKNLHSYVPFYFNPKNPMLYVNKETQEDIIILAFDRELLLKEKSIFTDGNAAVHTTEYFNNLNDLNELNWDCINSRYWNDFEDGKREVMAEILFPKKVKIKHLQKIYCYDEATKEYIIAFDNNLDVNVDRKLYF